MVWFWLEWVINKSISTPTSPCIWSPETATPDSPLISAPESHSSTSQSPHHLWKTNVSTSSWKMNVLMLNRRDWAWWKSKVNTLLDWDNWKTLYLMLWATFKALFWKARASSLPYKNSKQRQARSLKKWRSPTTSCNKSRTSLVDTSPSLKPQARFTSLSIQWPTSTTYTNTVSVSSWTQSWSCCKQMRSWKRSTRKTTRQESNASTTHCSKRSSCACPTLSFQKTWSSSVSSWCQSSSTKKTRDYSSY